MHRTLVIGLLIAFCFVESGASQEKRKNTLPPDFTELYRGWNLSLTRFSIDTKEGQARVSFVLEFASDCSIEDLNRIKRLFTLGASDEQAKLSQFLYFFDGDNVSIGRIPCWTGTIDGDITGYKGDAFRVTLQVPNRLTERARRVAWRMAEMTDAKLEK